MREVLYEIVYNLCTDPNQCHPASSPKHRLIKIELNPLDKEEFRNFRAGRRKIKATEGISQNDFPK